MNLIVGIGSKLTKLPENFLTTKKSSLSIYTFLTFRFLFILYVLVDLLFFCPLLFRGPPLITCVHERETKVKIILFA